MRTGCIACDLDPNMRVCMGKWGLTVTRDHGSGNEQTCVTASPCAPIGGCAQAVTSDGRDDGGREYAFGTAALIAHAACIMDAVSAAHRHTCPVGVLPRRSVLVASKKKKKKQKNGTPAR